MGTLTSSNLEERRGPAEECRKLVNRPGHTKGFFVAAEMSATETSLMRLKTFLTAYFSPREQN